MAKLVDKTPPEAYGEYPLMLYRSFDQEEYARQFAAGRFRFGNLSGYTDIKDHTRRDETEGSGRVQYKTAEMITVHIDPKTGKTIGQTVGPGIMSFSSEHTNPKFIMSCSYPPNGDPSLLLRKFGGWAVRIKEPKRFAQEITDHLANRRELDFPVECIKVQYKHGTLLGEEPSPKERAKVAYGYKPGRFADEYEYRLVLMTGAMDPPILPDAPYWNIDLGRQLDYVEVIPLPE